MKHLLYSEQKTGNEKLRGKCAQFPPSFHKHFMHIGLIDFWNDFASKNFSAIISSPDFIYTYTTYLLYETIILFDMVFGFYYSGEGMCSSHVQEI